ncbi:endonuclease/exonuclease/phosphatase family protein [soil metagenome]
MSTIKAAVQNYRKTVLNLIELAAYFCCICTLMGFFSGSVLLSDLFCHFRVQYLCILALFVVPSIVQKRWIVVAVLSAGIVANFCEIAPLYFPAKRIAEPVTKTLTVVDINFNSRNTNFKLLKSLVETSGADVICWQEFSPAADAWASKNLSEYAYSKRVPGNDNFGIAMFSKLPVTVFRVKELSDIPIKSIVATVQVGEKPIQVICTHTYPPVGVAAQHTRDLQLAHLGVFIKASGVPTILCGDLNATSWSGAFRDLLKDSGLKDSRQGLGIQPSWPDGFGPMMIPIDHVLVDMKMQVISREIGASVQSDHRPVIVNLAF